VQDLVEGEEAGKLDELSSAQALENVLGVARRNDLCEVLREGAGVACGPFFGVAPVGRYEGDVLEVPLVLAFVDKPGDSAQSERSFHRGSVAPEALHKLKAGHRYAKALEVGAFEANINRCSIMAYTGDLVYRAGPFGDDAIADAEDARGVGQGTGRGFLRRRLRGMKKA
jgi:hypothetical protein